MTIRKLIVNTFLLFLLFPAYLSAQEYRGGEMYYEYEGNGAFRIFIESYWKDIGPAQYGLDAITATGSPAFVEALSGKLPASEALLLPDGSTRVAFQEALLSWSVEGFYVVSYTGAGRPAGGSNFAAADGYGISLGIQYDTTQLCNGLTMANSGPQNRMNDIPVFLFDDSGPIQFDFNVSSPDGYANNYVLAAPVGVPGNPYDQMFLTGFRVNQMGCFEWDLPQPGLWNVSAKLFETCNGTLTGNCIAREFLISVQSSTLANQAPICPADDTLDVMVGEPFSYILDVDDPDGDNVTLLASGVALDHLGASFGQAIQGPNAAGLFFWVPPTGAEGYQRIQFLAVDDNANPLACRQNLVLKVQAGQTLETQCLLTEFNPYGFSFFLQGIPQATTTEYVFEGLGGVFRAFTDSTATITGTIVNKDSAHWKWEVSLVLKNRRDWATWSSLGRMFKGSFTAATVNHPNWDFYELDSTASVICGMERFEGDTLFLKHMPVNMNYGFQFGIGANDKNDALGVSGWFTFSGSYTGTGDCNVNSDCRGRIPGLVLSAMLEGAVPYWSDRMNPALGRNNLIPLGQPYQSGNYQYAGTESVQALPGADIVDWILIQLRDPFDPSQVVHTQPAFLRADMRVVDLDGTLVIDLPANLVGPYYVSLHHRNHLDIISRLPVLPDRGSTLMFDFTKGPEHLLNHPSMPTFPVKEVKPGGPWMMIGGDVNRSSSVNPLDIEMVGQHMGNTGYHETDANMDGQTDSEDADLILENYFKQAHLPE